MMVLIMNGPWQEGVKGVGKKFGCVMTPRVTLEVFLLLLKCSLCSLCSHHFPLPADHMFRTIREPGHFPVGHHRDPKKLFY